MIIVQRLVHPEELCTAGYQVQEEGNIDLHFSATLNLLWEDCSPKHPLAYYTSTFPEETYREIMV